MSIALESEARERLEKVLARSIGPEAGQLKKARDFVAADFDDLKTIAASIGNLYAVLYIRYRLEGRTNLSKVAYFLSEVILKGEDPQEWLRYNSLY